MVKSSIYVVEVVSSRGHNILKILKKHDTENEAIQHTIDEAQYNLGTEYCVIRIVDCYKYQNGDPVRARTFELS